MNHRSSRAKAEADEDYFLSTYQGIVFKYNEECQAGRMPQMLFDFLAIVDTASNRELSAEEIHEAADIIRIAKKGKEGNSADLNYKHAPESVAKVLAGWDTDKSGSVSVSELMKAAEAQKKMSAENRLVKKLLVGAVIVVFMLMAGTFALSLTAAEMAKETKVDQGSGIVTTASGNPAAVGSVVQRFPLVDLPGLGIEKLKEMRDFGYFHNNDYHHRTVSGFDWHSETKMELTATNGEVIFIDNGVLKFQKPGGQVLILDPTAAR